jgi:hypothetical protein
MEYVSSAIVGFMGIVLIWIGLFGGEISYSSKGAFPQIRDFINNRKRQKNLMAAMKMNKTSLDELRRKEETP